MIMYAGLWTGVLLFCHHRRRPRFGPPAAALRPVNLRYLRDILCRRSYTAPALANLLPTKLCSSFVKQR